ncbi:hypothetical protein M8756_03840 [Lutimaribacter sp. EGI FJ00015]|uniref:Uncharacterized protein n=1 Tax=Lutimaribacter degradans TaxID=2945989 RepID=A0ACC5ZQN8_9RHOB|nr:hypothetical protein [Lutimaribacter sp. EGI FJ00013]MCM2560629.1 hypothetical protein [Lutimaribacter sp. EGI FJ00013]MCO0612428.1 hypothetical protein [Lutimaribacter sp. EGI FJ00015]MCO0634453.1 hypothetical protein [Lutimaribacter sp. EGI FJ00014]
MSFHKEHELHTRRKGRNIGLGLTLVALICIVFGLTVVKVTRGDFEPPRGQVEGN